MSREPQKHLYRCHDCGHTQPKWAGQCPACGAWNSLVETLENKSAARRRVGYAGELGLTEPVTLAEVPAEDVVRIATGMPELDRVLGGGMVVGSATLLGGDPGIGKSTLLIQAMANLSQRLPVLYITGEESIQQVGLRARRLQLAGEKVRILAETNVEHIVDVALRHHPRVLVLDSVQTLYAEDLQSAPGSVAQVRECAARVVRYAKQAGAAVFLVGHVTKEGALAGPRVLEHMVDTVLYFEGEAGNRFRVVRTVKNRFGAANELGVFAMTETGLREVANPSAIFLSRYETEAPGSVIMVLREGSRSLLVEVQALVADTFGGPPRRVAVGMEQNRLAMLLAILHRHGGVPLFQHDVFVNLVGGLRLTETAGDLAVLTAIRASLVNRAVSQQTVVFGEVGLTGEVRPVPGGEERLREAVKHGFTRAVVPAKNVPKGGVPGLEVVAVKTLADALQEV